MFEQYQSSNSAASQTDNLTQALIYIWLYVVTLIQEFKYHVLHWLVVLYEIRLLQKKTNRVSFILTYALAYSILVPFSSALN